MIRRTLLAALVCGAVFFLPLAFHPERLAHAAPWCAWGVALTLLLTQPRVDLRASRAGGDRGSALGIFAAMIVAQAIASLEFATAASLPASSAIAAGMVLSTLGLGLRLWSIRTLGRSFTSLVEVSSGQRLVDSGPYRVLRHPSYTGALLTALGMATILGSRMGATCVLVLGVPAYLYRIAVEERVLTAELGNVYVDYRGRTWSLVPGMR